MAVEFSLVAIPLFTFILFIFELSYDLYVQEALDAGLHSAVRKLQTGHAQNQQNGAAFVNSYLCPSLGGLLECGSHLYVKVQKLGFDAGLSCANKDFFTCPGGATGQIPTTGNTLNLAGYYSTNFCNSGPGQVTFVSAIYVGPTFVGGLLPGLFSLIDPDSGTLVHATMSTMGTVTEDYTPSTPGSGAPTPAPGCS